MLSSKQSAHSGSSNDMKRSVSMLFDMDDMDTDDGAGPSSRGGSLGERRHDRHSLPPSSVYNAEQKYNIPLAFFKYPSNPDKPSR